MKAQTTAISQDWDTGEFSFQGTRTTSVNAKEETHASTFGHVLTGCVADVHRRYAAESGQDDRQPDACTMDQFPGVGKR